MSLHICMINDEQFPYKAADTINVVRTASSLGEAGARVELLVPWMYKDGLPRDELCAYYGVPPTFELVRLPSPAPITRVLRPEKLTHALLAPWVALALGCDLIYSRNLAPLFFAQLVGKPWVFETYRRFAEETPWLPNLTRNLPLQHALAAVTHSELSAQSLRLMGFSREAILTVYSGYLPQEVSPRLEKKAARELCGLDVQRPVVLHLGNVDPYIRIDLLLHMAKRIPEITFLFVGGYEKQQAYWKKVVQRMSLDNVIFVANRPPAEVRQYVYAADVLAVVPRNADLVTQGSGFSLSLYKVLPGLPMKIMLYAATGIPIFAPDLPYLREILQDGDNAVLFPVNSADQAATRLRGLVEDGALAGRVSRTALHDKRFNTWSERGKRILDFLQHRMSNRQTGVSKS